MPILKHKTLPKLIETKLENILNYKLSIMNEAISFSDLLKKKLPDKPKQPAQMYPPSMESPLWTTLTPWDHEYEGHRHKYWVGKEKDGIREVFAKDPGRPDPVYAGMIINKEAIEKTTPLDALKLYHKHTIEDPQTQEKINTAKGYAQDLFGDNENQARLAIKELKSMPPYIYTIISDGIIKIRDELRKLMSNKMVTHPDQIKKQGVKTKIGDKEIIIYPKFLPNVGKLILGFFIEKGEELLPIHLTDSKINVKLNVEEVAPNKEIKPKLYNITLTPSKLTEESGSFYHIFMGGNKNLIGKKAINGTIENISIGKDTTNNINFEIYYDKYVVNELNDKIQIISSRLKKLEDVLYSMTGVEGIIKMMYVAIEDENQRKRLDLIKSNYIDQKNEIKNKFPDIEALSGVDYAIAKLEINDGIRKLEENTFDELAKLLTGIQAQKTETGIKTPSFRSLLTVSLIKVASKSKKIKKEEKKPAKTIEQEFLEYSKKIEEQKKFYKDEYQKSPETMVKPEIYNIAIDDYLTSLKNYVKEYSKDPTIQPPMPRWDENFKYSAHGEMIPGIVSFTFTPPEEEEKYVVILLRGSEAKATPIPREKEPGEVEEPKILPGISPTTIRKFNNDILDVKLNKLSRTAETRDHTKALDIKQKGLKIAPDPEGEAVKKALETGKTVIFRYIVPGLYGLLDRMKEYIPNPETKGITEDNPYKYIVTYGILKKAKGLRATVKPLAGRFMRTPEGEEPPKPILIKFPGDSPEDWLEAHSRMQIEINNRRKTGKLEVMPPRLMTTDEEATALTAPKAATKKKPAEEKPEEEHKSIFARLIPKKEPKKEVSKEKPHVLGTKPIPKKEEDKEEGKVDFKKLFSTISKKEKLGEEISITFNVLEE